MKNTASSIAATCAALILSSMLACAADWPQWRGPDGQGHVLTTGLPLHWNETSNISWKTEIPGRGWSSPVIEGNQVWMTTAIETPAKPEDAERRLKANTGNQPLILLESVSLRAVCVDKKTGSLLHDIELLNVKEPQWVHRMNSYASPSPVIEDGRLYAHFGALGTACLDTRTGKVAWTNREHDIMHENGPGSTPIIWKDLMIAHFDGSDLQFIAAFDKRTGKTVWKTDRSGEMRANGQMKKSYGTPLVVERDGKPELISPASDWLYAYDPASGKELWKVNYGVLGFSQVPKPVAGHGMIYICTSFMRSELLAIKHDAQPAVVWRHKKAVPQTSSPLLVGNEIYFVSDSGGIVSCLDAITGVEHWSERIGGNFSASPIYADGRIYFFSREGVTTVLKPGKTYQVLAQNPLDSGIMASPAAVDGVLFARTETALYRIEQKAGKTN